MKYELTHDSLARQVFDKASTEARTRRKIEKFIRERYQAYRERKARLTQDDVDYVTPYLAQVNISEEEAEFVEYARQALQRGRRRIKMLVATVIIILTTLLGLAIWQWLNASAQREEALRQEAIALTQKDLAEKARQEAQDSAAVATRQRERARLAQRAAEDSAAVAREQRRLARRSQLVAEYNEAVALDQRELARLAQQMAKKNAELARAERDNALTQAQQKKAMRIALAARYALFAGQPAVAFRLAEETLAMGSDANADAIAEEVLRELAGSPLERELEHGDVVTDLGFSQDGMHLFTASLDSTARWWNLEGELLREFRHEAGVQAALLAADDQLLVTATEENEIYVWNLNGRLLTKFAHEGPINDLELTPDNRYLLSASADGTAKWWDLSNESLVQVFAHQDEVRSATFFEEQGQLAVLTASLDGTAKLWDRDGQVLRAYPNYWRKPLLEATVSPTRKRILFRTAERDFMTDLEGDTLKELTALYFNSIPSRNSCFSLAGYSERVASFTGDSSLAVVWNFYNPDVDQDFRYNPRGKVMLVAFSLSGKHFLVANDQNETVIYQLTTDPEDQDLVLARFNARMTKTVFSPNPDYVVSTDGSFNVQLWRFDLAFTREKSKWSFGALIDYYQASIHLLTPRERRRYQLD